jgi:predicted Zn-ribbon and HTH transcriptional regulator
MSASEEKDRFGDKLREVERAREDQFFKKRDQELLEKLRQKKQEEAEAQVAAPDRCPKCGAQLNVGTQGETGKCPSCGGALS